MACGKLEDMAKSNESQFSEIEAQRRRVAAERRKVMMPIFIGSAVGTISLLAILLMLWPRISNHLMQQPMNTIAQMNTAEEYYNAGIGYKGAGWVERSRECLKRAIDLDTDAKGTVRKKAERFLRTRIPIKTVSMEAEQQNIEAYNAAARGDNKRAKQIWISMTKKFPDFEWPYGNLASVYLEEDDALTASTLAEQVLEKNPHYFNAIMALASARARAKDYEGAIKCLEQAIQEDPDDSDARNTYRILVRAKGRNATRHL